MCDLLRLESLDPRDDPRPKDDPVVHGRTREQRYAERRALVPVSATMAHSFAQQGEGSFERLGRYEHRLEMSADRALRQLRQLRKERGDGWRPAESTPTADAAETASAAEPCVEEPRHVPRTSPAQNEPISAEAGAAPDAAEGCEQSSCDVVIVQPAPIARAGASGNSPAPPTLQ